MKRKYEKILEENPKSISASNALIFLKSVKNVGGENIQEQFLKEFIKKWTDQINRGWLIQPNAEFYSFFKHIELVAKNLMTFQFLCKYRNEDVRDIFKEKLEVNSVAQSSWDSLSRSIPNERLSKLLFSQIIDKWVDLRTRAFITSSVLTVKRKINSMSNERQRNVGVEKMKKSEPALRKNLPYICFYC